MVKSFEPAFEMSTWNPWYSKLWVSPFFTTCKICCGSAQLAAKGCGSKRLRLKHALHSDDLKSDLVPEKEEPLIPSFSKDLAEGNASKL
jgi:hypothetical protein